MLIEEMDQAEFISGLMIAWMLSVLATANSIWKHISI